MQKNLEEPNLKKPEWLKVRFSIGNNFKETKAILKDLQLHTVCEEAHCPNISECFENRIATFLILGSTCTRNCRFCAVAPGKPGPLDAEEPKKVAQAVKELKLKHAVITSVTRDDLADGGSSVFAETIRQIHELTPKCSVEVLIPDFRGSKESLKTVVEAKPTVLNHNVETVERLYSTVRPQAIYERSVLLLANAKEMDPQLITKSGLMVGLGETREEIIEVMLDLREADCDILTIGQYLRPSLEHLPIQHFYTPEEFNLLKEKAENLGFRYVECAPLVRSSYHAHLQLGAQL